MKKLILSIALLGTVISAFAQAPVTQQPGATSMPAGQMQPPAELINLLQKNAEKIDALIKQVKAGTDAEAKKIVAEIESIHDQLRKFEETQKAEPMAPTSMQQPGVKGKARKIQ